MMNFITSRSRRRSAMFEAVHAQAGELLGNPLLDAKLGWLAIELRQMHEQAFMPNLRVGVISVPKQYAETDGVAILPAFANEHTFHLDASMKLGTPARQRLSYQAIRSIHLSVSEQERFKRDREEFITKMSKVQPELTHHYGGHIVRGWQFVPHDYSSAISYASRPLIFLKASEDMVSQEAAAIDLSHNLVHAYDREHAIIEPPETGPSAQTGFRQSYAAYTEMRAYQVTAALDPEHQIARAVDLLSERYGIAPDPYSQHPEAIRSMIALGVIAAQSATA